MTDSEQMIPMPHTMNHYEIEKMLPQAPRLPAAMLDRMELPCD
jgi:hypothetical protein